MTTAAMLSASFLNCQLIASDAVLELLLPAVSSSDLWRVQGATLPSRAGADRRDVVRIAA